MADQHDLTARVAQLEQQQSLQTDTLAAILGNHYDDGPASAKGLLVVLNEQKFKSLVVVEKENLR